MRVHDAGPDSRIETTRLTIRRQRRVEQATEPAGDDEAREDLGVAVRAGAPEQTGHGFLRPAQGFHFEVRIQVVRDAEIWIELQRPLKRFVRAFEVLCGIWEPYFARTR